MYRDLKQTFYWEGMKRDVGEFISKCINCQLVKEEQRSPVDYFILWKYHNGSGSTFPWTLSMACQGRDKVMIVFGS